MNNCFTYTYKRLRVLGHNIPTKWENWTVNDMRIFITNYQWFLENKKHYQFFESFCEYVDVAQENDIIINDDGVGIAINKFKYMTIREKDKRAKMCDITKEHKILRIING